MLKIREAFDYEIGTIREQRLRAYEEHVQGISEGHWDALRKDISLDADEQAGVAEALIKDVFIEQK